MMKGTMNEFLFVFELMDQFVDNMKMCIFVTRGR